MIELPADIRAELERAGAGDQPSAQDQARVQQLLAAKLGIPEARWVGPPPSAASIARVGFGVSAKLWLGVIAVGIAATLLAVRAGPMTRKGPARESELGRVHATGAAGAREAKPMLATAATGLNAGGADAAQTHASNAAAARAAADVRAPGSDATRAQHAAPPNARNSRAIAAAVDVRRQAAVQRVAANPRPATDDDTTHAAANETGGEAWQAALTPPPTAAGDLSPLSAAEVPTRPSAGREPTHDQLARELPLLRGASRALDRGDAAGALHWVQEHAARFERGFLSEEREALRIIALCRLDRSAEANAFRRRFASQLAHSPLRARIARQCANAAGSAMQ